MASLSHLLTEEIATFCRRGWLDRSQERVGTVAGPSLRGRSARLPRVWFPDEGCCRYPGH
jgi:hypothetical protein